MCCGSEKTTNREVFVFEDTDADGAHDSNEPPLANVLIIATGNIHGGPLREAWTTDQDGRALVTFTYTHIFSLDAVSPCGYDPSTPVSVDSYERDEPISFGFIPRDPQVGDAHIRFHLWHDVDQDGTQDADEMPISQALFAITPVLPSALSFGEHEWAAGELGTYNAHVLETDDQGWAEINLGNNCGDLRVWEPHMQGAYSVDQSAWHTVITTPPATIDYDETGSGGYLGGDRLVFRYALGETVIEWGLIEP